MLDLRQVLMQRKIIGKYRRNRPWLHISVTVDVIGRERTDHRWVTVAAGCRHVRVAGVVGKGISTTDNHLPLSGQVIGKTKPRRESAVRQGSTALRYGSGAAFKQTIAVSEPVGP